MAYIYKNGAWTDYEPYKYGVNTVSFTTYPFTLESKTSPVTATIYGNMQQSGTPTPVVPIYPTETGDKTGNLCDESDVIYDGTKDVAYMKNNPYQLVANETITVSLNYNATGMWLINAANDVSLILVQNNNTLTYSRTSALNVYVKIRFDNGTPQDLKVMLNTGSTALPYEPYGYKIPILSGGTTTPVYLGEVQSVRHIRKYEFTGQESGWGKTSTGRMRCALPDSPLKGEVCFCSHYVGTNTNQISSINDGECTISVSAYDFVVYDADYTTYEDYVTWVAQQYANGTPVCIWYVLATETTGIVNEPIRKISDYSDSVTASIPVIVGSDTVDIDSTLKPSAVVAPSLSWGSGEDHKYSGGSWG